jgi:hypothetical protein
MYNLFSYYIGKTMLIRMSIPISSNESQNGIFNAKIEYVVTEGSDVRVGFMLRTAYSSIIKEVNLSDIYEIVV